MGLVDEEDDRHRRSFHLGDHLFEPVLKLAFDPRARLQQAEVEGAYHDVLQDRRDVALGHAHREALHDRRFADARLAREDRVVLTATNQDIHHLADFRFTPDNRINLALRAPR